MAISFTINVVALICGIIFLIHINIKDKRIKKLEAILNQNTKDANTYLSDSVLSKLGFTIKSNSNTGSGNFYAIHPTFPFKLAKAINGKWRISTDNFSTDIVNGLGFCLDDIETVQQLKDINDSLVNRPMVF